MLTKEMLDKSFIYKDGVLYWKKRTSNQMKVGDIAGHVQSRGYSVIKFNGKLYKAHRLIFLLMNGWLPKNIDHIDGNTQNNKIENLREANHSQNMQNRRIGANNTSGAKNVSFNSLMCKWQVRLQINKKPKRFGYYEDLELAELVATEARNKYHGEFARHF